MQSSWPVGDLPVPQNELSSAHLTQVSWLSWFRGTRFLILPITMLILSLSAAILMANSPAIGADISGLSLTASLLLAFACSLWLSFRSTSRRTRWAWQVIALAEISYLVAAAIAIVQSSSQTVTTATSVADVFFLPFYPLVALGAILFPSLQSTAAKQLRVIVDVCIGVGALVGLGLVFLIAPRVASGSAVDYVFVGYPVADLTVLLVLVVLLARGVQRSYRLAIIWLTIGMLCFIVADSAFNYLTLPGLSRGPVYAPGDPYVDTFWIVGAFALSLSPLSLLIEGDEPGEGWNWIEKLTPRLRLFQTSQLPGQFLLLAAPVLVLFGLVIFLNTQPIKGGTALALDLLTLLVILFIIVRQLLTMRDLVDARIATERAERLDNLKDQFITSVNHELRTPLMTVQGYVQLLADPHVLGTEEKRVDMLERTNRACGNLVHLVQSILDTRRIDQEAHDFVPEVVNVRAAAEAALALIDPREADPTHHEITLLIPPQLVIWGDTVRLQQIFTNLFSNAVKYSPLGSSVTVVGHMVSEKKPHMLAANRSAQRRQLVEITVKDQGLGIPPEQIPLLFRRFVRLPRDIASTVRGTGLGLHLCKVFTEAMGGQIWVESTGVPGEGSTFHLRLPVPTLTNNPAELSPAAIGAAR